MPTTIASQNFDGVTAPALPTGITYDASFDTSTTVAVSAPNSLRVTGVTTAQSAYFNVQDGNSGNARTTVTLSFTNNGANLRVIARATVAPVGLAGTYYYANVKGAFGLRLFRNVAGVASQIGTVVGTSATFVVNTQYTIQFTPNAGTQSITAQRVSDGFWLTSAGVWQSGAATALSAADTNIAATQGYGGVSAQNASVGDISYFDNLLFESLANPPSGIPQIIYKPPQTYHACDLY